MSGLTVYADLVQGTDEWLQARCGIVTASVVGKLITPTLKVADNAISRGLTLSLVAERITGHVEPAYLSADMWRGVEDEPRARDLYAAHYAPVTEAGLMVRRFYDGSELGYSPDGLVGDTGLIECKSRAPKIHLQTILEDAVPAENMAQIQAGLLVSGRSWCDYTSYCGGMPMWTKRVYPDTDWYAAIVAAVQAFESNALDILARYVMATDGLPATERVNRDAEIEF